MKMKLTPIIKTMKRFRLIGFLCGVIFFTGFSCKKNNNEFPVEFKLRLVDTLGNEKTVFNQGENIVFSFLVTNKSADDLMLENFLPNDEFFRLYQLIPNESSVNYGKPYDAICEIGFFTVPAKSVLEFKCPWVSSENANYYGYCLGTSQNGSHSYFLPLGNFFSSFSSAFNIGNIQTEEKQFEVKFSVK